MCRYSHTLNLTPLLPYIKALNAPPSPSAAGYLASDIPLAEARNPLSDAPKQKTTLLSFLVKGLILAMEEHPIMRARAREQGSSRFLDIGRDGVVGIAVSGKLPSRRCGRMFRSFFADIIIPAFIPDLADPKFGLVTPSLPRLPPTAGLSTITSALSALRQNPTKPTSPANITISSVGGLGEARGAMPVLPPGGGVAICAVGKARWEVEWKRGQSKTMDWLPEDIEQGGTEAVLRCPVGWSGDHRVVSLSTPLPS
jgi:2-oxoisovalerate dehydrogenase E2 component (dihydrolipoyl transacylase)